MRWSIHAFDIDIDRLAIAREATYGSSSLRSVDDDQRELYFEPSEVQRHRLRSLYRDGVTFEVGNILEVGTFREHAPFDVVFCRNVLIYFSEAAFNQAIANFAQVLKQGGLLFLGHSESLMVRMSGR